MNPPLTVGKRGGRGKLLAASLTRKPPPLTRGVDNQDRSQKRGEKGASYAELRAVKKKSGLIRYGMGKISFVVIAGRIASENEKGVVKKEKPGSAVSSCRRPEKLKPVGEGSELSNK